MIDPGVGEPPASGERPVRVVLTGHAGVAEALLAQALVILRPRGQAPEAIAVYGEGSQLLDADGMRLRLEALDLGGGLLVLTDLYGATPHNLVATASIDSTTSIAIVSGLSLPMLLRVMNYPDQPLAELARIAAAGARSGIQVMA